MRPVLILAASAAFAFAAGAQPAGQPGGDFADGPEKPLMTETCTACHVAAQVTGQSHSKEDWANLVDKMIGFGAKVPDDKYDVIVGYLASHYGTDKKAN